MTTTTQKKPSIKALALLNIMAEHHLILQCRKQWNGLTEVSLRFINAEGETLPTYDGLKDLDPKRTLSYVRDYGYGMWHLHRGHLSRTATAMLNNGWLRFEPQDPKDRYAYGQAVLTAEGMALATGTKAVLAEQEKALHAKRQREALNARYEEALAPIRKRLVLCREERSGDRLTLDQRTNAVLTATEDDRDVVLRALSLTAQSVATRAIRRAVTVAKAEMEMRALYQQVYGRKMTDEQARNTVEAVYWT